MTHTVTLIPGDGTGPELAAALETVIAATGVPIEWERHDAGLAVMEAEGTPCPSGFSSRSVATALPSRDRSQPRWAADSAVST